MTKTAGALAPQERERLVANWLNTSRPKREYAHVYGGLRIGLYMRGLRPFEDLRPGEAHELNKLVDEALGEATLDLIAALERALATFARDHPETLVASDMLRDPSRPALRLVSVQ